MLRYSEHVQKEDAVLIVKGNVEGKIRTRQYEEKIRAIIGYSFLKAFSQIQDREA